MRDEAETRTEEKSWPGHAHHARSSEDGCAPGSEESYVGQHGGAPQPSNTPVGSAGRRRI